MSEENTNLTTIAIHMVAAGLPDPFVLRVLALARTSEGIEDLMHLWADAPDTAERGNVEADLQEAIEDHEPLGAGGKIDSHEEVEQLLEHRLAWKSRLRILVESQGGVSRVAQLAGIPQPSLSRILNSTSKPHPYTILRLAKAMGLHVDQLAPTAPARVGPSWRVDAMPLLGKRSDAEIARLVGVSRQSIRAFRCSLGIPRFYGSKPKDHSDDVIQKARRWLASDVVQQAINPHPTHREVTSLVERFEQRTEAIETAACLLRELAANNSVKKTLTSEQTVLQLAADRSLDLP